MRSKSSNRDQTERSRIGTLFGMSSIVKPRRASRVLTLSGDHYDTPQNRPAFATDDWMLEQQTRAQNDADAWRELREEPLKPAAPLERGARHGGGSTTLKALVRFGLATFGAHLAWLAAVAFDLRGFEVWLAIVAGFFVTLSLSMFGYARNFVQVLAEAARWMIVSAVALSGLWLAFQFFR